MRNDTDTTPYNLLNTNPETLEEWRAYALGLADSRSRTVAGIHALTGEAALAKAKLREANFALDTANSEADFNRELADRFRTAMHDALSDARFLRDDLQRANDALVMVGCLLLITAAGLISVLAGAWS